MFYGKERIRYLSRVKAVGSNWVEFERPLPYDVRLKWKVRSAGTGEREGGGSWQNSVGILAGRYGRSLPTRQAAIPTACTAAHSHPLLLLRCHCSRCCIASPQECLAAALRTLRSSSSGVSDCSAVAVAMTVALRCSLGSEVCTPWPRTEHCCFLC
jgi:hypothetical protein